MKRIYAILLTLALFVSTAAFVACGNKEELSETCVIKVDADVYEITEETTLLEYMEKLSNDGKLTFKSQNGAYGVMIKEINGLANGLGDNPCWLLYTDDEANSDTTWGTYVYEGKTYSSATLGASSLIVKEGCTYIWHYEQF